MKIVNVVGSPRSKGNSAAIAGMLLENIAGKGAQVKTYELNKLFFRGCQGCMKCKNESEKCTVEDALTDVLEDVRTSDIVILSSPVYFQEITGQAKSFTDRCYSFLTKDYRTNPKPGRLAPGKKLVFIITQGNPDESTFAALPQKYDRMFKRFGFDEVYPVVAAGLAPDAEPKLRPDIIEKIKKTAGQLQ